jgi:hypothetical protein
MLVKVDVLVATSSFFPNANGEAEGNGPNVVPPGAIVGLEVSVVLEGFELLEAGAKTEVGFGLSVAGPDVDLFSAAPPNVNVDFDPSTAPPNAEAPSEAGLGVSLEPPSMNVGFEPSTELPKIGDFELSMSPPNTDVGLGLSAEPPNVNVGLPSVELPLNIDTGLEPPAAPPNKDAGLDSSAALEPELVPPNEKTGGLPEAEAPTNVEGIVLSNDVALADARVGLGGVDVEKLLSTVTGFPKRFVVEAEAKLNPELPNADVVPNNEDLAGSFEPAAVTKTDTGTAGFFDSSAAGTAGAPSVAPGGT